MAYTNLLFIDHSLTGGDYACERQSRKPVTSGARSENGGGAGSNRSGRRALRAREVRPIERLQRRFPLACQGVRSRGDPELPSGLTAPCEESNPTRELGQVVADEAGLTNLHVLARAAAGADEHRQPACLCLEDHVAGRIGLTRKHEDIR